MAFNLPYFYDYPPYFTLQPIQETRQKQSRLWQELILSYCRHHKIFKVLLTGEELPIFANQKINRRLNIEAKRHFLNDLVNSGHAAWLGKDQEVCLLLWKKLENWAATLYELARSMGMEESVMTIDELSSGSEVQGTELQGAPRELLIPAIRILEKRGKAKLFKGNSGDDDGVKFFP